MTQAQTTATIIGEPEVVEDSLPLAWNDLADAVARIQPLQNRDGSLADQDRLGEARAAVADIVGAIGEMAPLFPHDESYLEAVRRDFVRWSDEGLGVPDFLDSLLEFQPQQRRENGLRHLVVFPMTTQNGSSSRLVEAVIVEVVWPEFISSLEADPYTNALFVPIRFVAFTAGYDTDSAVLFPETVAMREIPPFTWGAIFADREAARFRRVTEKAAEITRLDLPADARRLLDDQQLAEETFVMWDLIHDRTHMRGDLPFDPFMIKQRMPFFLYSLEELRCDLTAFRECVRMVRDAETDELTRDRAALVQYAILFDRLFRFPLTGSRVRNYDGLGGQLLFAWLHQKRVLHWTDTSLAFDWEALPDAVVELGVQIEELYWRSIDRPKTAHWLAAYELVRSVLEPHPASNWARGLSDEILSGAPKGFTDAVLDDEFPLSMFYEALSKKLRPTIESTTGIIP